jgi:hypothetical protein
MVRIRYVGMHVPHRIMTVAVTVRSCRHGVMHVIVMPIVVPMRMLVLRRFMFVLVTVRFSEMEYYASEHEGAAHRHQPAHRLVP